MLEPASREGQRIPRYSHSPPRCCTPTTSATSSSCGASIPTFPPSRCWCSSTTISVPTTRRPCDGFCDSSTSTTPTGRPGRDQHAGLRALQAPAQARPQCRDREPQPLRRRPARASPGAVAPSRLPSEGARSLARRVLYGEPPRPDERLHARAAAALKPEVVALSEYLDRDLVSLWGYDASTEHLPCAAGEPHEARGLAPLSDTRRERPTARDARCRARRRPKVYMPSGAASSAGARSRHHARPAEASRHPGQLPVAVAAAPDGPPLRGEPPEPFWDRPCRRARSPCPRRPA